MKFVFLVTLFVVPGAVTALKHRWLMFAAGLLVGPLVWVLGFVYPAKPGSWWYVHVYRDEQRARVDLAYAQAHERVRRR
jgi:hypothetical protein